jgi:hypothetical protein
MSPLDPNQTLANDRNGKNEKPTRALSLPATSSTFPALGSLDDRKRFALKKWQTDKTAMTPSRPQEAD